MVVDDQVGIMGNGNQGMPGQPARSGLVLTTMYPQTYSPGSTLRK